MRRDLGADHPIANASEAPMGKYDRTRLFLLHFGQIGSHAVYVWADGEDGAFEEAVEYLDDKGLCGFFTTITKDDLRDAVIEENPDLRGDPEAVRQIVSEITSGDMGRFAERVLERAEADLTLIGHTTLRNCEKKLGGGPLYVPSDEWFIDEIDRGTEWTRVFRRSVRENRRSD